MRTWDLWNRYLDNNSKPLHGCIQFMVKDGNTVAPIYDVDGTALDNPILTDEYGRTLHQVCIDEDVVAYFYKYVGNGMWNTELDIDTSDTSKWSLQYTSESNLVVDIDVTGSSAHAVSDIGSLRNIDVDSVPSIGGNRVITLLGYNKAGDKEPVNYIWDPESTLPDDGGAVIATGSIKGRWIMVPPTEHLDVRHYGVFPSDTRNMADQTVAVQSALAYANSRGLRLFFDIKIDVQSYIYYKISNVTLNPIQQVDVAKGVHFLDTQLIINSNQINAFNTDPYFYNGDTTLYSNYAKASWNIKALFKSVGSAQGHYIIDDNTLSTGVIQLQGWTIDVQDDIEGYTFNDCIIQGKGNITNTSFTKCTFDCIDTIGSGCSFTNCKLTQLIFKDSPVISSVTDCTADITDFTGNVQLWYNIQYAMNTPDLDFNNVSVPSALAVTPLDKDRTYSNFIGTSSADNPNVFADNANVHTYRFINCQGNIKLGGNANNTYIFDSCSLNVTFTNTDKALNIVVRNSDIIFNDNLLNSTIGAVSSTLTLNSSYTAVAIRDSIVKGLQSSTNLTVDSFSGYGSLINQTVTASKSTFKDCQINKELYANEYRDSGHYYIDCFFDNCVFNGKLNISSSNADTIVRGTWTNNIGNAVNPIVIDRTNLAADDTVHSYIYKNNSGTMEMKSKVKTTVVPYDSSVGLGHNQVWSDSDNKVIVANYLSQKNSSDNLYYDDDTQYFSYINLFAIGTINVDADIRISLVVPADATIGGYTPNSALYGVSSNLAHVTSRYPADYIVGGKSAAYPLPALKYVNNQWQLRGFIIAPATANVNQEFDIEFTQI